ncbi:putative protein phosphatase 2C 5 [Symbiodinium microadriaticum]|uniref:protein-serine/threonine phosphatase n=1 Tax=Symbiodinium microadriaticum TaxID=2951 RepID=A0A1Q9EQK8_SYMMI|nr:putative protein phosphatase 2C 5 [Symbiodinium microadriaticum]
MSKLSYRFTFIDIEKTGGSDAQGRAGRVRSASPSRCWASIASPDLTDYEVAKQHLRRLQGGHVASEPAEAPAQSRSRGSVGHPTLCAKPCIQFARGLGCRKGHACGNCHWPHHPVSPDKRQREFSKTLGKEEFFVLLAVLARERALQDGLEDVGFLLAVLEVQAGLTPPAAPTKQKARLLCNLRKVIQSMSFSEMMRMAAGRCRFYVLARCKCARFGIFDGHGGSVVSGRAAQELPNGIQAAALECMPDAEDPTSLPVMAMSEALFELDKALRSDGQGEQGFLQLTGGKAVESSVRNAFGLMGSTAVMAMIECDGAPQLGPPTRIVVANLGDSRAIVCRGGEAIPLSEDHKPEAPTERERIEKAGGCVRRVGPCYRIDGWGLNLSRALGDFHYKAREDLLPSEQKVSVKPDCHYLEVSENDEFLFLGCDGVFELYSSEEAVESIRSRLQEGKPLWQVVEEFVDDCCSENLASTAGRGGDNVSAMVVLLK